MDLWKDVDARNDALETKVVKEWREDGVVCRYVIFKVGTFKGADSRIAAFYCYPEGAKKAPAFVYAHGGGQRPDWERGLYFAKQGYATVDMVHSLQEEQVLALNGRTSLWHGETSRMLNPT